MNDNIKVSIASALILSVIASLLVFRLPKLLTPKNLKEQAIESLESNHISVATAKLEEYMQTEEGTNDRESEMLLHSIKTYNGAEKLYEEGKYEEALELLNTIDTSIYSFEFSHSIDKLIDKLLAESTTK